MPCFKGLAVSIHTPTGPLSEYSIQKQSKFSRITSYIPVPPAKVPPDSTTNKPEQSTFAISITLLTPGLNVPYSAPRSTEDDPYPRAKIVGGLPGYGAERGRYASAIGPYIPLTTSPNETIAAYIYFDGRQKEEVATLLRRGEETWVNSRWVSIPDSEGGGLAEREFLFREVGLERWLNGLDLDGKEAAAKIERRRQRQETKRRKRREAAGSDAEAGDMDLEGKGGSKRAEEKGILKYGSDDRSPLEKTSDDDEPFFSDSDSDAEPPLPEATGQIKVALFRVLASGEIKRGEYSPQFDAHDDDEESQSGRVAGSGSTANGEEGGEADIDHTTSFAKPKTLDPKSISTQTVTGIDGPDKPYAVFTFLYRGERQLQKMGILPTPKVQEKPTTTASKRRSVQTDFAKLPPLKAGGTVGFSTFRDKEVKSPAFSYGKGKIGKKDRSDKMDSDEDDDDEDSETVGKLEDVEVKEEDKDLLSPEDAKRQGELAEGVRQIKLKRQHSAEPLNAGSPSTRKSPASNSPVGGSPPPTSSSALATPPTVFDPLSTNVPNVPDEAIVGSPLKRQRASLPGFADEDMRRRLGLGLAGAIGDVLGPMDDKKMKKEDEEEL
ncbi:MAG: hypothetical protein M1827_002751 [Pycnora praestabilis]|nr:MAG: hypothetical protein M1827_002751 [Pycnora praestabilis]